MTIFSEHWSSVYRLNNFPFCCNLGTLTLSIFSIIHCPNISLFVLSAILRWRQYILDTRAMIQKTGYQNPEELKINLRVREILKILIVSVWQKSSIFALWFLIRTTVYLRGPFICEDGAMVECQLARKMDSNSEKSCFDAIFPPLWRTH